MTPDERAHLVADLMAAIGAGGSCLNHDEQQWVRLAITKQEQSIKLRQAIIEKTLAGLVWAAILGLGAVLLDFAKNHGFR